MKEIKYTAKVKVITDVGGTVTLPDDYDTDMLWDAIEERMAEDLEIQFGEDDFDVSTPDVISETYTDGS